jgi:hypothetical protein
MTDRLGILGLGPIKGGEGDPVQALQAAEPYSPYLARVARRMPKVVETLAGKGPEAALSDALTAISANSTRQDPLETSMRTMRRSKEAAHLITRSCRRLDDG